MPGCQLGHGGASGTVAGSEVDLIWLKLAAIQALQHDGTADSMGVRTAMWLSLAPTAGKSTNGPRLPVLQGRTGAFRL